MGAAFWMVKALEFCLVEFDSPSDIVISQVRLSFLLKLPVLSANESAAVGIETLFLYHCVKRERASESASLAL